MPDAKHRSSPRKTPNASRPRGREAFEAQELCAIAPFSALPPNAIAEFSDFAQRLTMRARATLQLSRDFSDRIGVVSSGRIRLVAISANAGHVCLNELDAGDVLGLCTNLLGLTAGANLRLCADRPAEIVSVSKMHFLRLMRAHADFNSAVVHGLSQTVVDLHTRLFEVAALDVRTRLAGRLLALAAKRTLLRPILIANAPTHAILAAEIGASREAVSRHLADLEKERMIVSRRRVIEIVDWPALEALYARGAGGRLFRRATEV
ncbi:MAG: Crp/Fnr family transcriptional regulator [Hyphomonadaceae bacterium]